MKAKEKMREDFEKYYNSEGRLHAAFLTREALYNIYIKAYIDGYDAVVESLKVKEYEDIKH